MDDFQFQYPRHFRATNKQRDEEKKRKSGGIPDRWLDYLGVNTWIENTRFIAFKCPLKPELQKHLPVERRFTLGDLVEKLDDKGKEIGLIIDLTNTDRYYKAADIADAQIQYEKMMTPGHNQIPNETCYQRFAKTVRTFLEQNKNNDKLIGVHCTHGLNRTGYLIIRYMIEEMNYEPDEALEAFNRARGHSMEKYTEDLLRRKPLLSNTQAISSETNVTSSPALTDNNKDADQISWPTLYSTVEHLSISERQKSSPFSNSASVRKYPDESKPQLPKGWSADLRNPNYSSKYSGHDRPSSYGRATVVPRVLNSSINEEKGSIQSTSSSSSTYFGSGSNVGRGRPMTNDR